jgi:adenine-specific DNA-methyltransferase
MSLVSKPIVPSTQCIKYAGSKRVLLPHLLDVINGLDVHRVLDGFSGSTRVSQALAQSGYEVTCSDRADWSEVFGTCYLYNTKSAEDYSELIAHLNALPGYDGWFTEHYGGDGPEGKRPFQGKNTRRLDAIRDEIDRLDLNEQDRAIALTSLILALDAVDNTLGHFAAYLSGWSPRAQNDLVMEVPQLFTNTEKHSVLKGDIFDTLRGRSFDLAYLDPPYGSANEKMPPSRIRYAAYYHLWTTVVRNDRPPVFGKAARREDSRDARSGSAFEDFRKNADGNFVALEALRRLLEETQAKFILLSYSSGGRATRVELLRLLEGSGILRKALAIDHKRHVMSAMRSTNEWTKSDAPHQEYLFLLEKNS